MARTGSTAGRLTTGMPYTIPALRCRLESRRHPLYDSEIPQQANAWLRPYVLDFFGEDETATPKTDGLRRQWIAYWGAWCYPTLRADRFFACMVWMEVGAMLDDVFAAPEVREDPGVGLRIRDDYLTVLRGGTCPPNRYTRILTAALQATAPYGPTSIIERMKEGIADVIEQGCRENHDVYDDIESYLKDRDLCVFGDWLTDMGEWGLGIDLSQTLTTNSDLREQRALVMRHWSLVNDLYSFPKEIEAGENMNSVLLLMRLEGLTLQQSIDRVAAMTDQTEEDFVAGRDRLLENAADVPPDVINYLAELEHMISGNLRFHLWSSRYHGHSRPERTESQEWTREEATTLHKRGSTHNLVQHPVGERG